MCSCLVCSMSLRITVQPVSDRRSSPCGRPCLALHSGGCYRLLPDEIIVHRGVGGKGNRYEIRQPSLETITSPEEREAFVLDVSLAFAADFSGCVTRPACLHQTTWLFILKGEAKARTQMDHNVKM